MVIPSITEKFRGWMTCWYRYFAPRTATPARTLWRFLSTLRDILPTSWSAGSWRPAAAWPDDELVRRLLAAGCRLAGPGEFTRRAFMNGKMDLAQAEAVADLIASTTAASHRVAYNQLRGGFSNELALLRSELVEMTSLLELELDFSEEEVEFADRSRLVALIDKTRAHVTSLADTFKYGNAIRNGVPALC